MAKFFISHSARPGTPARSVLEAVRARLEADNHSVFVDDRIRPGRRWRPQIYDELAQCDAAIVLLDHNAMRPRSFWVRREVYNLMWRHYLGSVHIYGVLMDSVDVRQVRAAGYGELVELQLLRDAGEEPAKVAESIVAEFDKAEVVSSDPMRRWLDEITDLIRHVGPGNTLNRFALELGVGPEEFGRFIVPDCYRFLAHQLLGRPQPESTFRAVDVVSHIAGTAGLAHRALPALVDGQAARVLLRRDDPRRVVVINAEYATTAEIFVMRAGCAARTYRSVQVSAALGDDLTAELMAEFRKAVAILVRAQDDPHGDRFRRKLAAYRTRRIPALDAGFLIVDPAGVPLRDLVPALSELRDLCPWLTVIVLTGDHKLGVEELGDLGRGVVVAIDPPLSPNDEADLDAIRIALTELSNEERRVHA
ncbi:toll/interleukin-1 receptor domain-containing protein [Actinoplanes sp. NPDC049548]|uniref:toll/interleukin-1 receptor domain-containing protein n=1 Tax=Actinoplanes sp. NPDC049548 TaxID=3155152 RepID=UPI00341E9587